jgi:uncharacterized membrane protein
MSLKKGVKMSNLFVLAFQNEEGAGQTLDEVVKLQKQNLISVDDAAIAVHHQNGKVKVHQGSNLSGAGAMGGAFWGLLFGLIFFVPFVGMAIGAASGALMGKLTDYGIDDKMIKEIGDKVEPGTSALFLMSHDAQREKVIDALRPYGGELIQSSLSPKEEASLKKQLVA